MTDTISANDFYEKSRRQTAKCEATEQPSSPSPTGTESTEPIADEDRREPLFGSVDTLVASYRPALSDSLNMLADHTGLTPSQRDALLREHSIMFDDAGIAPDRAVRLHKLFTRHIVEPADEATVNEWAAEARREARDRYGQQEADRRIEIAREFVKNRPALAQLLTETGVGSHPDFIRALIASPHTLRINPRAEGKKG